MENRAWPGTRFLLFVMPERPQNNTSNKKHMLGTLQIRIFSCRLLWPVETGGFGQEEGIWKNVNLLSSRGWRSPGGGIGIGTLRGTQ